MKMLLQKCRDELSKLNGLVVKSEGVDCQFDDLLSDISKELMKKPETIEEYYAEWETKLYKLAELEEEQMKLKKFFKEQEFEILTTYNFKETYGKDNDKIRDGHIRKELHEVKDKEKQNELEINKLKREIDFIKSLMNMQRELLQCGVIE